MAINKAEMLIFPDSKNREVEFVKKHIKITVAVLISIIFASTGFAFSKVPPEKSSKENLVTEKVPAPQAPGTSENTATLKKIMTEPKISGFVGTATLIEENLMQVKDKKEVVTFDTSNPVLKGYKGLSDVVVGDTVAVEYTKDGIKITKLRGTTKAKVLVKKKAERVKKSPKRIALTKITAETKGSGFVGTVTMVYSNLIDVLSKKGEVVTFDTSNPVLKGYKDLSDVVVGDTVAVEYTKDGIKITKLRGTTKAKALVKKKTEMETKSPRKTVVTRVTCTGKGPCAVSVDKKAD